MLQRLKLHQCLDLSDLCSGGLVSYLRVLFLLLRILLVLCLQYLGLIEVLSHDRMVKTEAVCVILREVFQLIVRLGRWLGVLFDEDGVNRRSKLWPLVRS